MSSESTTWAEDLGKLLNRMAILAKGISDAENAGITWGELHQILSYIRTLEKEHGEMRDRMAKLRMHYCRAYCNGQDADGKTVHTICCREASELLSSLTLEP